MKKYILAIIQLAFLWSCDDLLDRAPETTRTDAVTFYTAEDFELAVNNLYNSLKANSDDLDADIACEASSAISSVSESSYGIPQNDSRYSGYYTLMRRVNQIFANTYKIADKSTIASSIAEAHFFRAYFSYDVFKDFGPLPIIRGVLDTSSPELYAPRAGRDEFADFIISDLETAIGMNALPLESEIRGTQKEGRITLGAAYALLGRFCLFEGTWQKYHNHNDIRAAALFRKSAEASLAVMNDQSYELFRDEALGAESYRYMFILEDVAKTNPAGITKSANHEYVLRKRYSDNKEGSFLYTSGADTKCKIVGSRKMAEMYLSDTGEIAEWDYKTSYTSFLEHKDPRFGMCFKAPNSYIWCYSNGRINWTGDADDRANVKLWVATDLGYPNRKWITERALNVEEWGIDLPLIRLAEVYLNYAEAIYEIEGEISDAQIDKTINKLRDRVGMVRLSNASIPEGSDMLKEIRRERTVELYLEGFRYDDLRRWATAETEMSSDFEYLYVGPESAFLLPRTDNGCNTGMPAPEKVTAEGYALKQEGARRKFEKKHYLLPLPSSQLELNPSLDQNPFWE